MVDSYSGKCTAGRGSSCQHSEILITPIVCGAQKAGFFVTCVGSYQTAQRDRSIKETVDEKLGVELWCDSCALKGLMFLISSDLDGCRDLRVEELFVFALLLFVS